MSIATGTDLNEIRVIVHAVHAMSIQPVHRLILAPASAPHGGCRLGSLCPWPFSVMRPRTARAPDRLSLPFRWCAQVFADGLGAARHLAIGLESTVYAMTDGPARTFAAPFPAVDGRGPIIALQDLNGDGQADAGFRFGEAGSTGLALIDNTLFVGEDRRILRYPLDRQSGRPIEPPAILVSGFPDQRQHAAKSIALDNRGSHLFVNVGAPSNACQRTDRRPGSPGRDPCPERDVQAGIWRYDATRTGQRHPADGTAQARGVRHAVALAWRRTDEMLYAVQHGRDQLSGLWPDRYDAKANAENPAEELLRLTPGSDFGWPCCYFDPAAGWRVLAPEYGGDEARRPLRRVFATHARIAGPYGTPCARLR